MGTPTVASFLGQPVSDSLHPGIVGESLKEVDRLDVREMAAFTNAYVEVVPGAAKRLMQGGRLRQLHSPISRFAGSAYLAARIGVALDPQTTEQAPLFKKNGFTDFQFVELLYMLNQRRKPGERVVRVQVLSSRDGFRVSPVSAVEARQLPPNESVTLWAYYGRGENSDRIVRLKVRYSVVDDQRPTHRFRTTISESGVLTTEGWIRYFSGKNTSWWDYGPKKDQHGFNRSTYRLPKNRSRAQETAAAVLRPPLEFAWRALKGFGWKVVPLPR